MNTSLCRCCLSNNTVISILDTKENYQKFLDITSIEVTQDDGLPQCLCLNCFELMRSAHTFREQCREVDKELKFQLEKLKKENNVKDTLCNALYNEPFSNLDKNIKTECMDEDEDDNYYVLVIDDEPKDKNSLYLPEQKINSKLSSNIDTIIKPVTKTFEDSIESFLIANPKIPDHVPEAILESEDIENATNDFSINGEDTVPSQNIVGNDAATSEPDENQIKFVNDFLKGLANSEQSPNKNYIKVLSTAHGNLMLNDKIAYLTDSQNDDASTNFQTDNNSNFQPEVILYETDETTPLKLMGCESSDLVIEYADDDQEIATIYQQEDGTFLCECGELFQNLADCEKHQYTHKVTNVNSCDLCGKVFETAEILTGHKIMHNTVGDKVVCPFCKNLMNKKGLIQHIKYGHNPKPTCEECNKSFANTNNLKRHMLIHKGIKDFECDICYKKFSQKITMQTHKLTHINTLQCTECDKIFDKKFDLAMHKESNSCSKSKVSKLKDEILKTAKREIKTTLGKILCYACSLCNKMFNSESVLEQHIGKMHLVNPEQLLCTECGAVFLKAKEMEQHIQKHKNLKGIRRFGCSSCGKGFASQAMLTMHERVHTNERPFACQLCPLKFKTKTHLNTHQLTHTREKKFGCSVCMKFFALKGNLVVHLRTHTGERPYVCDLCEEAFIDSKYLRKHRQKKHGIYQANGM